jgi:hypothetical protein
MPLLARTVVHYVGGWSLCRFFDSKVHTLMEEKNLHLIEEIHALSSAMTTLYTTELGFSTVIMVKILFIRGGKFAYI